MDLENKVMPNSYGNLITLLKIVIKYFCNLANTAENEKKMRSNLK